MKLSIIVFCLCAVFVPAMADDDVKIVERKTCEQIKLEIANLKSIESPDSNQLSELKQLTAQQRANCGAKGAGRRAIPRSQPVIKDVGGTGDVVSDALSEYLNNKRANCEYLSSEIKKLTPNTTSGDVATEMQHVYDTDCTERVVPEQSVAEIVSEQNVPDVPEKTDEEWATEFDANLAAGLCGDGTKPNRFGCCTGETFKDLGEDGFACCPKSGGMCFPPIKK